MQPCLAATGTDSTVLLVLAGLLAVAGIALAVVAVRRRGAAGLLLLALPLLAGGSLLATPAPPAQAQVGVPCPTPTPTPTPTCTPIEEVPDASASLETGWFEHPDDATRVATNLNAEAVIDLGTTNAQVNTVAPGATKTVTVTAFGPHPPQSVTIPFDELDIVAALLSIPESAYGAVVLPSTTTIRITITFDYDDGCGTAVQTVAYVDTVLPPPIP